MKLFGAGLTLGLVYAAGIARAQNGTVWPVHDTGLSKVVQWDHYSLMVNGQRLFVWSGEFHYWRIPVPEVWRDILTKVKAAGFNAVSVYGNWGYHSASPGALDFESGAHNFESILDDCKELGLYVIWRAGPYVNAETTAGGFALWATTGAYGSLRNNDTRYTNAWMPYMKKYTQILSKHQVTNGGNLVMFQIENEIAGQRTSSGAENWPIIDYMKQLEQTSRQSGLVIPFFTNAPNMGSMSWSKDYDVNGAQDIYGLDSYPACWSCNLKECGNVKPFTVVSYHEHFDKVSPTQPSYLPEFQGGSYNPWGGPQGGCSSNMGPDFANVFYRHNIAERVSMMSLYMLYGGTNWGKDTIYISGLATNLVGTSYDYSSPISESRQIGQKYYETKLVGMFIRAAKDLTKVDRIGSSTAYTTNALISATELRNPDTKAGFYVTIHTTSSDQTKDSFKLHVSTSRGNLTIPTISGSSIMLNGRDSKIVVTDFTFGNKTLLYSTAEVLSHATVDGRELLALWLPQNESGEFVIKGGSVSRKVATGTTPTFATTDSNDLLVSYTQGDSAAVIQFDDFTALLVPRTTAWKFWAPTLTADPFSPADKLVFVTGPYLVRAASLSKNGALLELSGDADSATAVEVFASSKVTALHWNGQNLSFTRTSYGSLKGKTPSLDITGSNLSAKLADTLKSGWKVADGLPERFANYSDSGAGWKLANKTTTPNPTKPSTLPVLYADDYGFHLGNILWRGRFNGKASGVQLNVQGGTASGWSAWLNGDYIGSFPGDPVSVNGALNLTFANATVSDKENVLLVLQDHSGHDQRDAALYPRGILKAALIGTNATFSSWRVAGNAGGEKNIDPVRGPIAEGGLHAERLGWHLPGFDDSKWASGSPADGVQGAGVVFYRKNIDLSKVVDKRGYDVLLEFIIDAAVGTNVRAQLYVNGYQYGKFVKQVGNQIAFPVPPGILNLRGINTIGLSVWSQSTTGAKIDISWNVLGVYDSAWDSAFDAKYLQPEWTKDRLDYA
ncbi:glycoside hydrolase family 35 protein [Ceratobasidium sp. AG-Ba]|nr:glycoside hydrolase family 35 protein [Ceratobasidium sp. AG-Ba]